MKYRDKEVEAQFKRIYSRLDKIGKTWEDFLEALGLYPQLINNWKRRGIAKDRLPEIAGFLEFTIDELMGRQSSAREPPGPIGWPFPNVPQQRFYRLRPSERLAVEAAMVEALEQIEHRQREKNRPPKRPGGNKRAQPS